MGPPRYGFRCVDFVLWLFAPIRIWISLYEFRALALRPHPAMDFVARISRAGSPGPPGYGFRRMEFVLRLSGPTRIRISWYGFRALALRTHPDMDFVVWISGSGSPRPSGYGFRCMDFVLWLSAPIRIWISLHGFRALALRAHPDMDFVV